MGFTSLLQLVSYFYVSPTGIEFQISMVVYTVDCRVLDNIMDVSLQFQITSVRTIKQAVNGHTVKNLSSLNFSSES